MQNTFPGKRGRDRARREILLRSVSKESAEKENFLIERTDTVSQLSKNGWYASAKHCPSTHYNARPDGTDISLVVLHFISLPEGEFGNGVVESFFLGKLDCIKYPELSELKDFYVASHFFVTRDGSVTQFVGCGERAWHAGVSSFGGLENCNDYSIGIELEGTAEDDFCVAQYETLAILLTDLCERYPIRAIVGHCDVAPGRKIDPGERFDWVGLQERLPGKEKLFCGAAAIKQQSVRMARAGILV